MKAAVVVFPGTNCDRDTYLALSECGFECDYIWHDNSNLYSYDAVFLCGGFSFGDYIRSGAIAKFSPVVSAIKKYIQSGRGVCVGICNGFQILCEAGLLPGALIENESAKFICKNVPLELLLGGKKTNISLPIAHREGRYYSNEDVSEMVFLKYLDNPNGSIGDIAGLYDKKRRIMGLMPHPERAVFARSYGYDGRKIFKLIEGEIKRG